MVTSFRELDLLAGSPNTVKLIVVILFSCVYYALYTNIVSCKEKMI